MAYQPAANLTSSAGLPHLQSVYYKKKSLDRLQKKFVFRSVCEPDQLPLQSGRTVQFFRYSNLAASTTATTEGTVGSSLSLTTHVLGATVSQYSAFINVSDFLQETAIDPIVTNGAEILGYQAGLSVDTMTRNVIDSEYAGCAQTLVGTYATVKDLRAARHALQAVDVQAFEDGNFEVIVHPFNSYDIVNDPNAAGLADIFKYNTNVMNTPLVKYEDRGIVTVIAGCRVRESTNVKVIAGSPNLYTMYFFGKEAVGCVDLAGKGPTNVVDPRQQRFAINTLMGKPSMFDPEGVLGAAVSYNFKFTTVILDGPAGIGGTFRMRQVRAQSSIG